uniref:hypothetical protein n=1 Tax=Enhygromyxa salina TaxID=215803 RepID=UPI00280BCC70
MASADYARLLLFGAVISSGFGLACNGGPEVSLETYNDSAAEDYGCILGDLECECAAGDQCDAGLTCQQGICRCITQECKEPPPTTGDGDSETGMETGTETAGDGDSGDGDGDT